MRKILRNIGVFALCVIAACILIFMIGLVVDLGTQSALKAEGESALQELKAMTKEIQNNAWDYYARVIQEMQARGLSSAVNKYLNQENNLTQEIKQELNAYQGIVELIRQATAQPHCWAPIKYEDGITAQLPEYLSIVHAAKLLGAQALAALETSDRETALDKTILGLKFTAQMMQSSPILMNHMVSDVMRGVNLHVIEVALYSDAYNDRQLEQLREFLSPYENNIPSLLSAFELEQASIKVTMMRIPVNTPIFDEVDVIESNIFAKFTERLVFWRYLFSPHNAMLKALQRTDDMLAAAQKSAQGKTGTDEELAALHSIQQSNPEAYAKTNVIFALYRPSFERMIVRKIRNQARVRMVVCALLLRLHQHKYGNFPKKIDAFDPAFTEDPFTNEYWDYQTTLEGVELKSPGYDREFGTDDDIFMLLR